ncbi:unnamed protein product [Prorocentrum cordatum]|uniref:Uncharacterized protein n=1 Tax=Prorocentrum cordatum TaxID=2364126 RepID=A0ABN9XRX4_9DINO|nr:unnamed protein product [Polarella glacialis]
MYRRFQVKRIPPEPVPLYRGPPQATAVVDPGAPAKTEARWMVVAVRRELEDALQVSDAAAAGGEDAALQAALEQHEAALRDHERVLRWCDREREGIARSRALVSELERAAARSNSDRERFESSEGSCVAALSERLRSLRAAKADLERENEELANVLKEHKALNQFIQVRNDKLVKDNSVAQKKASRAREVLAQRAASNLLNFRASREAEMAQADGVYQQAVVKCEEYVAKLQQESQARDATLQAHKDELREDIRDFQQLVEGKKAESSRILLEKGEDFHKELADSQRQVTLALRRFKEMLHDKRRELEKEISSGKRSVQVAVEVSRRQMEVQLQQLNVAYRNRMKWERKRVESCVKRVGQEVAAAAAKAKAREHQAKVVRENFRMHAINSRDYVKSLDPVRRKQLHDLHWRAD